MVYKWTPSSQNLNPALPDICFLCGDRAVHKRNLCVPCRRDLPSIHGPCLQCGREIMDGCLCPACTVNPPGYDRLIASHRYNYPVTVLIKSLKYRKNIEIARELGLELAKTVALEVRSLPEALLPVPLHPLRIMERGFNQALEIARVISKGLRLPVDDTLIKRTHHTLPQYKLGPKERRKNLHGAFKLTRAPGYRSVALVDDIVTTGTTVNEIAGLLKRSGLKSVEVWACARVA